MWARGTWHPYRLGLHAPSCPTPAPCPAIALPQVALLVGVTVLFVSWRLPGAASMRGPSAADAHGSGSSPISREGVQPEPAAHDSGVPFRPPALAAADAAAVAAGASSPRRAPQLALEEEEEQGQQLGAAGSGGWSPPSGGVPSEPPLGSSTTDGAPGGPRGVAGLAGSAAQPAAAAAGATDALGMLRPALRPLNVVAPSPPPGGAATLFQPYPSEAQAHQPPPPPGPLHSMPSGFGTPLARDAHHAYAWSGGGNLPSPVAALHAAVVIDAARVGPAVPVVPLAAQLTHGWLLLYVTAAAMLLPSLVAWVKVTPGTSLGA